jgi:hypothetical protein
MKLVTFETKSGDRHIGALLDGEDQVADFTASAKHPPLRVCPGTSNGITEFSEHEAD